MTNENITEMNYLLAKLHGPLSEIKKVLDENHVEHFTLTFYHYEDGICVDHIEATNYVQDDGKKFIAVKADIKDSAFTVEERHLERD